MAGPAGGGGADQGGDKNTYYILWILLLIFVAGGTIWYFFDEHLKAAYLTVKIYEAWGLYLAVLPLASLNIPFVNSVIEDLATYLEIARNQTPSRLTVDMAEIIGTGVGEYLRYPVAVLLIGIAIYTYRTHLLMRCTIKHSMKTLLADQMDIWPQVKIANKLQLLDQDLDSGPWGMAMTPLQFCKKYKLIHVDLAERTGLQFAKVQGPEFKITLNRARTERAFAAQLGRPWQSMEAMPIHRRAILTILAARGARDSNTARALIHQLASSAADGKINISGIDALWHKHKNLPEIQKICNAHAYEFTVFASMLLFAREDGVMASVDFLWVKPLDRRLWYVLNNVGRQTPVAEVGGIFAHWYTELALKRPLSVPDITGAIVALELALADIIYVADDKEREEIYKRHQQAPPTPTDTSDETQELH